MEHFGEWTFGATNLAMKRLSSLLTVPRRQFCCGSLLPVFGVSVSVTFHLLCVNIILSSVSVAGGHLLRNSCSLG